MLWDRRGSPLAFNGPTIKGKSPLIGLLRTERVWSAFTRNDSSRGPFSPAMWLSRADPRPRGGGHVWLGLPPYGAPEFS